MAYHIPGGLGEFRGRVAGVVVYRWRQLKLGRSRPGKSSRKPSKDQKRQRSRLGLISRYLSKFVYVVRDGYNTKRMNITSMNAAVKQNFHTAVTGEYPNLKVEDALVQLSKGTLDHVYRPTVKTKENGDITVEWINPDRQKPGVNDHDTVHLVFYSDALRRRQLFYMDDLALRKDDIANVPDTVNYFKGPVHVWMFLLSADGKRPSNSRYLGVFNFIKK
ncbi:MAG: DUF6266 family protein [Pedobacter sp.]|jgi:hypothetical protein|uniref:DUF6266 family protein n=1 Tax=Pedobacter sp. TaxID=1411316 RepID=UPI003390A96C